MWTALLAIIPQIATGSTIKLVPDLRVGTEHHEFLAFSDIRDLAVGPDGRMFIAQPMDGRIIVVDDGGRFVASWGQQGSGPGEFENINNLQAWRGGVVASDYRLGRTTTFGSDGSVRDVQRLPANAPAGSIARPVQARLTESAFVGVPGYIASAVTVQRLPLLLVVGGGYRQRVTDLTYGDQAVRVVLPEIVAVVPQPVSSHSFDGSEGVSTDGCVYARVDFR